ncbi:putative Mg2+ transporter-C (MgtC) family protein [Paracoccus laeviglucosivorans]|uniref:Protein MgtC n=2 Tax=Paracoccus laeviglucosivorans TaxID=1197861 RepID=A0A521FRR1_9RHOB|nr:putative Mg2+ transporter-C (MgtC) family protein [Paracoccus laeviglucosivorans]
MKIYMNFDSLGALLSDPMMTLPLLGSVVAGGLIGAEREFQGKSAGLRTHVLVCFASALMTLLALRMSDWTLSLPEGAQVITDMSRMPHAILTGIGFLCAGVIFREGASVQGLTTAASLWLTAALGITFGAGLLELATMSTIITLLVLMLLRLAQKLAPLSPEIRIELEVDHGSDFNGHKLHSCLRHHGIRAGRLAISQDNSTQIRCYKLHAALRHDSFDSEELAKELCKAHGVRRIAVTPLEKEFFR